MHQGKGWPGFCARISNLFSILVRLPPLPLSPCSACWGVMWAQLKAVEENLSWALCKFSTASSRRAPPGSTNSAQDEETAVEVTAW